MLDHLKIAIVCDWLTVCAGAERVIFEMYQLFPKAPIYTSLYRKGALPAFREVDIRESSLRFIPGARVFHRLFLPWMPFIFENLDLSEYDLVLSSSHSSAKGIITRPETLHISYCHSPMRYVWDHSHSYQDQFKAFSLLKPFYKPILHRIRLWDRLAAERVDRFIANSHYVAKRIEKYYGKKGTVIYPPVDLTAFRIGEEKMDHYLAVGRLIPYKRFDLVLEACKQLKRPLRIVGEGPQMRALKKQAGNFKVDFLGKISDAELKKEYQSARALLFPQLEDFGLVPLEAMACGTPVIAYGRGGVLETIQEDVGGLFFSKQTASDLAKSIKLFEKKKWDPSPVAQSVSSYSSARFRSELRHFLENAWKEHQAMLR